MKTDNSLTSVLGIPEQHAETGMETRPKQIGKWVASLPRANVGEMAKSVFKTLYNLNRTEISDANRFKILEIFQEPVEFLTESLKKQYLGLSFPLAPKKQQIALLAREIQSETAIGYKIIIENTLTGQNTRANTKLQASTVYHALQYTGFVLLRSYQIYVPVPSNIWKQVYRLYMHAEQNNIHNIAVDTNNQYHAEPTIENLFKQILLLSLVSPYRLPQSDIEKVDAFLEQWGSYIDLNEVINQEKQTGMFTVNMGGNDAPGYLNPNEASSSLIRTIETKNLVSAIRDDIKHYSSYVSSYGGNKNKVLSKKVLKRLYITWNGVAKRGFSRISGSMKVLVTFGLSSAHHIIYETMKTAIKEDIERKTPESKEKTSAAKKDLWPVADNHKKMDKKSLPDEYANLDMTEPVYNKKSKFNSTPSFGIAQPRTARQDVWNQQYNSNVIDYDDSISSFSTKDKGLDSIFNDAQSIQYETHMCKRVNESASGYCLSWHSASNQNSPINALVGELVGIRELNENEDPQWGVGVIRWMKHTGSKQLELGIQKIAPHAISAGTMVIKNIQTSGTYLRTLVLPEIKTINQPMSLIAPTHYSVGNILSLNIFGDKVSIKLSKLLETTGAFSHFQFVTLSEEDNIPNDQTNPNIDFDDVWSSIK